MVRAVTATAVKASISAPVLAVQRTRLSIRMPGRAASGVQSTSTSDSGSGWHSGISSLVRLAAWMPAMRATIRTSPLGSVPSLMARRVVACIRTAPLAVASRAVSGLAEMSTIWAAPCRSRWDSRAISAITR